MNQTVSDTGRNSLLKPILIGGVIAGVLDEASAMIAFGWGVPRAVASGLMGQKAFDNGVGTWLLGVGLHFAIAISAAAVYCLLSARLKFLREHYIVGALFLGIAAYLTMNILVLPISAVPFPVGPFTVNALRTGLLAHVLFIGLPIAISLRLFSKPAVQTRPSITTAAVAEV